jgi:hypothetical protein
MKLETKFRKLLKEYRELENKVLNYNQLEGWVFDAMGYDADGYDEELLVWDESKQDYVLEEGTEGYVDDLENQVKAFKQLLDALDKIEFTFC